MISQKFIALIDRSAEQIARQWVDDVTRNVNTPFYHHLDRDKLLERGRIMYKNLSQWLEVSTPKAQITSFYRKWGWERFQENIPLPQLIYAFILFRRHLWLFILHSGFFDTAIELLRALELNNRVILFFDRALHSIALGYEEAQKNLSRK
jgi:hypothetical protein